MAITAELPVDLLGETGSHLFAEGHNATICHWISAPAPSVLAWPHGEHGRRNPSATGIEGLSLLPVFPPVSNPERRVVHCWCPRCSRTPGLLQSWFLHVSTFPRPVKMLKKCHCLALTVARLQGLLWAWIWSSRKRSFQCVEWLYRTNETLCRVSWCFLAVKKRVKVCKSHREETHFTCWNWRVFKQFSSILDGKQRFHDICSFCWSCQVFLAIIIPMFLECEFCWYVAIKKW